ncbi:MAG: hypothetical protein H6Q67_2030 [Firmicutes bacterium]|nr:hypothetical protein [Bacillota bacterium]
MNRDTALGLVLVLIMLEIVMTLVGEFLARYTAQTLMIFQMFN